MNCFERGLAGGTEKAQQKSVRPHHPDIVSSNPDSNLGEGGVAYAHILPLSVSLSSITAPLANHGHL